MARCSQRITKNAWWLVPILSILGGAAVGVTTRIPLNLQSFNAGELSPLMNARSDFPKYHSGAKTLQNMLVRSQGPIQRRPGTRYIASVKDPVYAPRLLSFIYSTSDAYVIEMGHLYARFYRTNATTGVGGQILESGGYAAWLTSTAYTVGTLVTNGGSYYRCLIAHTSGVFATDLAAAKWVLTSGATDLAYEIVTPYDGNDVFEIQTTQDAQYMRLVHPDYKPRKLTRTGHAAWTLTAITFANGPFLPENDTTTSTITPSATTGNITLDATATSIFDPNHVGSLWQLRHLVDTTSIQGTWSQTLAADQNSATVTVYEDQQYSVVTSGVWYGVLTIQRSYDAGVTWETVGQPFQSRYSANEQLTGTETEDDAIYRLHWALGEQYDGRPEKYGLIYTLASLSFWKPGIVEITAVVDANDANATVIETLGGTSATYKWSEGSWSTYRGWPRTVEHHEQRCVYGGTESFPQTIWASIIAGEDTDYDDFDAGQIVTESDAWTYVLPGMSPIQWLKSQDYLMVGTTESIGRLGTADKPINPTWPPTYRVQAKVGAEYMQPIHALDNILYVERGAKKVREIGYTYASERYIADDMTILAEHVTGDGIVQVAFQTRPDPILWAIRDDGVLLSFTYNPRHEVGAWAEQVTDGDFNSVAVTPGPISEDDVYSVISRSINSATVRYVEQFTPLTLPSDQNDYFFVDCGLNAITGLSHLQGETVSLWANGRPIASQHGTGNPFVVTSGAINPNDPTLTEYTVGLPFTSVYESMPIVAESQGVSSALMKTAVLSVNLDLQDTMTMNIGRDTTNKSQIVFSEDSWATTIAPFTGIKSVSFPRGISRSMTIYLDASEPGPLVIRSISPTAEINSD